MMRSVMSACCVLLLVALSCALPMAQPAVSQDAVTLVEILPAQAQESLHTLNLGEPNSDASTRDKRTIGFLRENFPSITEIIDRKIQTITRFVFRLIGRLVLGGGGAGAATESKESDGAIGASSSSASGGGGNGRRISITLPTYPPSLDDEEDEDEDEEDAASAASSNDVLAAASDAVVSTVDPPTKSSEGARRVARATADQESAASDAETEDTVVDDTENRDKRFLFGFGGGEGGAGGSAGGSGNFLFDIIRGTADRTARTAGNIYRMVAGTSEDHFTFAAAPKSFGLRSADGSSGYLGGSYSNYGDASSSSKTSSSLIAGSGNTEEVGDAHETTGGSGLGYSAVGAQVAAEVPQLGHTDKDDGYTSGIPGPITRLFIIANRGVSNLIQDLILRLAQTSERIVNFKARLITSVI